MSAGSTPTARSSGAAVPSDCSMSAASRCSGSTWGLPFAAAFLIATESASWLFRVSLSSMGLQSPFILIDFYYLFSSVVAREAAACGEGACGGVADGAAACQKVTLVD